VGRQLGRRRGLYCHQLGGWLVSYSAVRAGPAGPESRYCWVAADWRVWRPRLGLLLTVTFLRPEGGAAICRAEVAGQTHEVEVEEMGAEAVAELLPLQTLVVR
jgi:hypothetical protein